MKYFLISLLLVLSCNGHAQTQAATASQVEATQKDSIQQIIQSGISRLQAFIQAASPNDPQQVRTFLDKEVAPYFDFQAMSRMIIGPLERQLTEEQKTNAQQLIKEQFIASFARNLLNYRGGHAQLMGVSGSERSGMMRVRVYIYRYQTYPTVVELRLGHGPEGWKIYDVAANGMSAISHFRNFLHSTIQRSGIEVLNSK